MAGVSNLSELLAGMEPYLNEEEYVFCSIDGTLSSVVHLNPICTFFEVEGLTVVIDKEKADLNNLHSSNVFSCITISINSSLEAVGFTAAISSELSKHGISANVVAAYHHDHIFVPVDRAHDAMQALGRLQERSKTFSQLTSIQ